MGQRELKYSEAFGTAGTRTAGRAPDSSRLSAAEDVVHEAFRAGIEIRPISGKITVKADGPISDSLKSRLDEYWPAIEALLAAEAPNSATSAFVQAPKLPPWPEPTIAKNPHFGVDKVPRRYEAAWKALLAGCPSWAAEWQWAETIFGWFLKGKKVMAIGARHAFLDDGRIFEKAPQ
jgi:hypothetical protein